MKRGGATGWCGGGCRGRGGWAGRRGAWRVASARRGTRVRARGRARAGAVRAPAVSAGCAREVGGDPSARDAKRRRNELPRALMLEELRGHRRVQGVAAAMHDRVREDRIADECEVAHEIEDLVADELVLEAERAVQDAGVADDDRVVER